MIPFLVNLLHQPPVLSAINFLVLEIVKRTYEKYAWNIPNALMPFLGTLSGAGMTFAVTGDPILGTVVGAASTGIHEMLSPRKNT